MTLPLGLAACSGGSSTASSTTATTTQSPSSSTTSSSTATSSSSAPGSADNGAKPSKKDASAGLSKILRTTSTKTKITTTQADKIADCVVNKTYSTLTPKTLKAMATGNSKSDPDTSDEPVFTAAVAYCVKAAGIPIPSSSSS